MKNNKFAYLALVVAMILWSLSYLVSSEALKTFSPTTMVAMRMFLAAIILGAIGQFTGRLQRIKLKHWKYFLLAALCEPFIYFIGEAKGLETVSPTISSVILSLIPLFTPLFAWAFLKERVTWLNCLGLLISLCGVVMIIFEKEQFAADVTGLLFLAMAVISAIMYTIILRKIPKEYNTLSIVFYMFVASLIYLIPTFIIVDKPFSEPLDFNWIAFGYVVSLALFASCGAFLFYSYGILKLGATKASAFNNIQPALTAIFSWVILGEILPFMKIAGILVVIGGLFISQVRSKKSKICQ